MTRRGFNEGWAYRTPIGPFAAVQAAGAAATPVTLPHDALRDAVRDPQAPGGGAGAYFPPGAYTYLKDFFVPTDWAERAVALEFEGAMRHAMVFVNDEFAGNRADGYARFFVDVKPFLRFGATNQVRVEVRTGQDSRWYSGAGLHRGVHLHVNRPVHVVPDGVRVTTVSVEPGLAVVEVATTVANLGPVTVTAHVANRVEDAAGATVERDETPVTLPPGSRQVVRQRFYLGAPRLWGPGHPHLYVLRTALTTPTALTALDDRDETITRFGVRTIQVDPVNGLRLNGERILLRGACIHHDNGPLGAAAAPRAEERRIDLLLAAGFNAIRSAHNPASVAMLDACDRLGMLVMDEAFDMWVRGKTPYDYALDFPQWWAADLASLVAKDYNHPSVVMYSLGNEIAEVGTPHGSVLARTMAEHVRGLDPTRLITNGVNSTLTVMDELAELARDNPAGLNEQLAGDMGDVMTRLAAGESATARTAESHAVLDVVGLNYGDTRYAADRDAFPHRIIVGSETFPSRIGWLWPLVEEHPHVIGDFTWTGWDYLGEVGIGGTSYAENPDANGALEREYPWLTAWCGDFDITGWRRPISYYREIVFGLRAEPYLAVRRPEHHDHTISMQSPWAWTDSVSSWTWPGHEGRPVTVEVYADADEVVLLLSGAEVGRADVGAWRPMTAVIETVYVPGELVAVALRGGVEVGRTSLVTAGPARLSLSADRAVLRADPDDLAFVAIEWRDDDGRLVTSADRLVSVEVGGAGVLAGMCSANPATTERFDSATWRTFDGRALAVIRPSGRGAITVVATSDDGQVARLGLEASDLGHGGGR